jgi:hypothetical protein
MRRSGFGAGAAFPGARIRARGLLVWLGSSHTYWADTLVLSESRCKVGSGADDCVSSKGGVSRSERRRLLSRGSRSAAFHRARAAAHGGGDLGMLGASQRGEACNYSRIFRSADQAVSGREALRFAPTAPMAVPACLRRV